MSFNRWCDKHYPEVEGDTRKFMSRAWAAAHYNAVKQMVGVYVMADEKECSKCGVRWYITRCPICNAKGKEGEDNG